ncbi:WSCD family member AAEL009094 [Tribolium madens]|uniref:WSCD family member AAEL009094 n=1 Tax=Tribolium madens TaxID=41895 RepID=UPI001CF74B10|nr:WSCD family member AAEL009094 [Tribolium madens]
MHVTRVRYWILAILLFLYIAGVLFLSAVTLHEPKNLPKQTDRNQRLKNYEYGFPGLRPPLRRSKIQWCSDLKYINPAKSPVALVSFPGSGNTWLRYLLQQASGFYTGSVYKDYGLLKNGFPAENIANGSVLVVKTHEWGHNARRIFSKAILLVRAPGAAIQAEFNRQSGGHIGFASPDRYKRTKGKYWQQFVNDKLEAWKQTNLDWLYNFTGPTHVIFYEQLVDNLEHTLKTIINFLDISPPNEDLFKCALERKEGIYRRKRRVLNFDPYTDEMKRKLEKTQKKVYEAIYNFATPS